jgi:chitinase
LFEEVLAAFGGAEERAGGEEAFVEVIDKLIEVGGREGVDVDVAAAALREVFEEVRDGLEVIAEGLADLPSSRPGSCWRTGS